MHRRIYMWNIGDKMVNNCNPYPLVIFWANMDIQYNNSLQAVRFLKKYVGKDDEVKITLKNVQNAGVSC